MKDGARPEDRTCNLLNTSRTAHLTDLAGLAILEEEYVRKFYNGCLVQIENAITLDNCSTSFDKPYDAKHLFM